MAGDADHERDTQQAGNKLSQEQLEQIQEAGSDGAKSAAAVPPVVGFGASAGGLEAFTEVLENLPPDIGLSIVLVQHLDPKHASALRELLSHVTRMPVVDVTDGMPLQPNRVHIMPPNTSIVVADGQLRLEGRAPATPHLPIDRFFRSLAESQASRAVAVVLSGTASDGTLGLKAIKQAGGITLAQEPETAKYDGMPRSAIAAGCVDAVLSPKAIADELVRLVRHPYLTRPRPAEASPEFDREFGEIFAMLRTAKGVDFSHYKPGTIRRRLLRRMALHKFETPHQYVKYIREHREELDNLFQDVLINVTGFFREPATFEAITTHVLPQLLKQRAPEDSLRVWVPGCATGEEAYSIAICLLEYTRQASIEVPVQIFGTDLSEAALEKARAGIYPETIATEVTADRLRRFFVPSNGMYQIARSVRDLCIFARQNVASDPPFSRLDLIMCRNLLIYLGPALQQKVMRMFHYGLKPSGYLVLGVSETVGASGELFAALDRHQKIYTRKPTPAATSDFGPYDEYEPRRPSPHGSEAAEAVEVHRKVDQILLARHSPPAVVVDRDLRILQFRGDTSGFLGHPPGDATLILTRMTRGGLGIEVRKLVQKAAGKAAPVKSGTISTSSDGGVKDVRISVTPIHGAPEPQFVVVFEDAHPPEQKKPPADTPVGQRSRLAERIRELERELAGTKQYLQSVIEEQEAGTEELKSAHEEVQSSNEELQSTNEELLTAKEELQSTNEELTTVNEEMQCRNMELQQINNDLINLLSSVNIPIVMLGNDLRIRRFTPQGEKLLNLLPTDVGRPISDFRLKINVPDLVAVCQDVIDTLAPKEREVQDAEGRAYSMWVRPYRTADNRIDGVVLALLDITERKQAAEARYRRLFEAAKDGIVIADAASGEIVDSNPFVTKLLGWPRARLVGVKFWESELFAGSEIDESMRSELHESEAVQKSLFLPSESGDRVEVDIVASLYSEGERKVVQFNIRDISARRRLEEKVQRNEENVRQAQKLEAVGRLAGGVAHDFNNILTAVLGYADLLDGEIEPDHPGREFLDQLRMGAERASTLTKQLLAFGRKQIVSPSVLDANEVIVGMRHMVGVMLPENVDLELALNPEAGRVRADRTQLEQVVLNLVLNARDAMPGGGTIKVSTSAVDLDEAFSERHPTVPAGKYFAITVEDTGTGMDEETRAHLFEPFYTTKPKGSGVGLGLATAYNIVRQAGGYIRAYSELGVGSTLTIYLPRIEAEESGEESAQQQVDEPGGTETVLLVEDEHAVRDLARRFLESRGYRVLTASSGPEALRISREYHAPIPLMVTDVVMPRMSGRELALQLALERPEMKVLYMSGHTEDAIIHHGVLEKGIAFMQKPFSRQTLVNRVRRLLDGEQGPAQ